MRTVGVIVRDARMARGLTQRQLAEMTTYSQGYINGLENGRIQRPKPDTLANFAKTLELSPEEQRELGIREPIAKTDMLAELRRIAAIRDVEEQITALTQAPEAINIVELALQLARPALQCLRQTP